MIMKIIGNPLSHSLPGDDDHDKKKSKINLKVESIQGANKRNVNSEKNLIDDRCRSI